MMHEEKNQTSLKVAEKNLLLKFMGWAWGCIGALCFTVWGILEGSTHIMDMHQKKRELTHKLIKAKENQKRDQGHMRHKDFLQKENLINARFSKSAFENWLKAVRIKGNVLWYFLGEVPVSEYTHGWLKDVHKFDGHIKAYKVRVVLHIHQEHGFFQMLDHVESQKNYLVHVYSASLKKAYKDVRAWQNALKNYVSVCKNVGQHGFVAHISQKKLAMPAMLEGAIDITILSKDDSVGDHLEEAEEEDDLEVEDTGHAQEAYTKDHDDIHTSNTSLHNAARSVRHTRQPTHQPRYDLDQEHSRRENAIAEKTDQRAFLDDSYRENPQHTVQNPQVLENAARSVRHTRQPTHHHFSKTHFTDAQSSQEQETFEQASGQTPYTEADAKADSVVHRDNALAPHQMYVVHEPTHMQNLPSRMYKDVPVQVSKEDQEAPHAFEEHFDGHKASLVSSDMDTKEDENQDWIAHEEDFLPA